MARICKFSSRSRRRHAKNVCAYNAPCDFQLFGGSRAILYARDTEAKVFSRDTKSSPAPYVSLACTAKALAVGEVVDLWSPSLVFGLSISTASDSQRAISGVSVTAGARWVGGARRTRK